MKAGARMPRFRFLLMAGLLLFTGCSRHVVPPLREGQAVPSTIAVAAKTNVPIQLPATGHMTALTTVVVRSRVDGFLEKVHFQEGDEVKKGSLLFSVDPLLFEAGLRQAKASLERDKAMARYAEIKICPG
jgi:multidrug efflux system membrane fusion protein